MKTKWLFTLLFAFVLGFGWSLAQAADVIITPLGSTAGEFCALDRAMLFEDPSGVNILIQPGRTVSGSDDPRLVGIPIHVILLDHAHGDHIGDQIDVACNGSGGTPVAPIPNIAEIAAAKNSALLVGGELGPWLSNRIIAAGAASAGGCSEIPPGGTLTEVSRADDTPPSPCVDTLRPGASRELALNGVATGVKVSTVQATHSNGIPASFINGASLGDGMTGYGGTETGYVIRFSNGLSVYWSGDSGFFGDMKLFSKFYKVNLAIPHIGDVFTMGPLEAAFAVNKLIKPKSVIPTHANQVSTTGGAVNPGTRIELFISEVKKAKVIVPLSGVPIFCDGKGKCTQ